MKIYVACERKIKPIIHIDGLTDCQDYMYSSEVKELDTGIDLIEYIKENPDIDSMNIAPDIKTAQEWVATDDYLNSCNNRHGYIERGLRDKDNNPCIYVHQIIQVPRIDKRIEIIYSPEKRQGFIQCYSLTKGIFEYQEPFSEEKCLYMKKGLHFEEKQIFNAIAQKYSMPEYVKREVDAS